MRLKIRAAPVVSRVSAVIRRVIVTPGQYGRSLSTLAVRPLARHRRKSLFRLLSGALDAYFAVLGLLGLGPGLSVQDRGQAGGGKLLTPLPVHPRQALLSHGPGLRGIGEQLGDAVRDTRGVADDVTGFAVEYGVRGSAGVAANHWQAGGRRLQVDDAETLHVQPAAARAAGHGEHVRRVVVAGELGPRDRAGEDD